MKKIKDSPIVETGLPCKDEACGSSDAMVRRENQWCYCFSCAESFRPDDSNNSDIERENMTNDKSTSGFSSLPSLGAVASYRSHAISSRGISQEVVDHFQVKMETSEDGKSAISHLYPYTKDGEIVAYKRRNLPKEFSSIGNMKDVELFGQAQAGNGGKTLVITEGEIDCLSVGQAFKGYKTGRIWPVVSVPSASAKSVVLAQRTWINRFEKVVLMLDNDDAGNAMRDFMCKLIRPGRAFIAKLPEKDANATLMEHDANTIMRAIWDAVEWSPVGIVKGAEIWEQFQAVENTVSYPYPACLGGLNDKLKGIRLGEIDLFTSGTGSGKSTVIKEIILHLLKDKNHKVGLVSLEESIGDSAGKFISMQLKKNIMDDDTITEAEKFAAYEEVFSDERLVMLDHQGSLSEEGIIDKLEYLALMGCTYIIVDHITLLVSEGMNGKSGNEAQDALMSDFLKLVKKHNIWLGVISHLRKSPAGGTSFEQGNLASLDDLKGSGSLKQVAFSVIAFARDLTADDATERNTVQFRVLKSRFTGLTGNAGSAIYDHVTTRLTATSIATFAAVSVPKIPEPSELSFKVVEEF